MGSKIQDQKRIQGVKDKRSSRVQLENGEVTLRMTRRWCDE